MKLHEVKKIDPTPWPDTRTVADTNLLYHGGNFDVTGCGLTSLEGCPEQIDNNFSCSFNSLESLNHGPTIVRGFYNCADNHLTTLEGIASHIDGQLDCSRNDLTSFEFVPRKLFKDVYCLNNKFTNFHDIHKHLTQIGGVFNFTQNDIKSHILGLLMIEGVTIYICDNNDLKNILNDAINKFPKEPKKRVLYGQKRMIEELENGDDLAKL